MQSAAEYIAELDAAIAEEQEPGAVLLGAVLVVRFETSTTFVKNASADRLAELTAAIDSGGKPIGVLFVQQIADEFYMWSRPLREYISEEWASEYLDELIETSIRTLTPHDDYGGAN